MGGPEEEIDECFSPGSPGFDSSSNALFLGSTLDSSASSSVAPGDAFPAFPSPTKTVLRSESKSPPDTATWSHIEHTKETVNLSGSHDLGESFRSMGEGEQSRSECLFEFKRGQEIGSGAYGRVFMGMVPEDGRLIAIKQLEYMENCAEVSQLRLD